MTANTALSRRNGIVIAGQSSFLAAKLSAVAALCAPMAREWRRRSRSRRDLMTLNERELWDIRLSRSDAVQEASKPFWQD